MDINLQWCDDKIAARGCQLQASLISQEVIANKGINSHLWCQKGQLNPSDILSPLYCPDLLTRAWHWLVKPLAGSVANIIM